MNRYRKIIPTVAFVVLVTAFAPTSASATSLLSGYGGPGQGTQAILGSTLLNGPSGGGGGSGSGQSATPLSGTAATTSGPGGSAAGPGGSAGVAPGAHRVAAAGVVAGVHNGTGGAYHPELPLHLDATAAKGSGVFGLSDSALFFGLLALAALFAAGLFTRGLARDAGTRWNAGR